MTKIGQDHYELHIQGHTLHIVVQNEEIMKCETNLDGHNFTSGLLKLLQLSQEVPEPGLGNDDVWGEDPHLV